jgi:prefoldin subunit 5
MNVSEMNGSMDDAGCTHRLERDIETLAQICKEKDEEIAQLRDRIRQLQASRWRKLGQRLRLAMTMDWEKPEG